MNKKITLAGAILILIGIALGAFGAHGLKKVLTDVDLLNAFETGVKYQMYHGIALLSIGLSKFGNVVKKGPFILMFIGVIFFSGSIYLLVANSLMDDVLPKMIGAITPIGGTLLMIAWLWIVIKIVK